jgi:putative exporter of polyketide antibiotics
MFSILEKAIIGMAFLRLMSGCIEIFAAYLMLRFNEVEKALIINSTLAFIGPLILLITTAIGVVSIADKLSIGKFIWIVLGVSLILYGIRSD